MGARFTKFNCFCCMNKKQNLTDKTQKDAGDITAKQTSTQTSEEILSQLKADVIIKNSTTAPSGVAFNIIDPNEVRVKKPRRLPSLKKKNKVHPTVAYNINDRLMMAEIRRDEVLSNRGKMGRGYETRRQAVLQRREENLILDETGTT